MGLTILLLLCLFGCNPEGNTEDPDIPSEPQAPIETSYLALGDSYTIGESVPIVERWPVLLAEALNKDTAFAVGNPKIIARTGWTTDELQSAIAAQNPDNDYSIVSLLIGVNNQFRGYPFSQYETEFVELLDTAIEKARGRTDKVFVVSIPDYGVTPFGQSRDTDKIAKELDEYNAYAKGVCEQRGIPFIDITPISREAKDNADLVASDGLHPSGEMYRRWVEIMTTEIKALIKKP
ncbi:MAG: SGNH/GDSL hydrolase family protein [Bacteroidota bacterium]